MPGSIAKFVESADLELSGNMVYQDGIALRNMKRFWLENIMGN